MISQISAANAYHSALSSVAPTEPLPDGAKSAISDFSRVMDEMDRTAQGAMTGQADTHDLVQSIARAELALDTVTAIRDKVVEAYQELMRMPV
ncbi:flagellar hook-basal body complex protein FliE [Paracoccus aminophilus]|uniref:Flagellar hook-basal body complex protein FliE n=1 Tax=Paracoccus aminophilus JCM 7686 TaxID=1367847 RepID=S5YY69_PARAH|nr:flagellar hook-basal body complex protein FliE [Paracoccus aminophilus]AGT10126.1 flagellar hook-basal body complex protein FliE [Paracoccus aminophilus JCM 7686]